MKSISKFIGAVAATFVAACGTAYADLGLNVPEPGSVALVGVAIAALVLVSRKNKK